MGNGNFRKHDQVRGILAEIVDARLYDMRYWTGAVDGLTFRGQDIVSFHVEDVAAWIRHVIRPKHEDLGPPGSRLLTERGDSAPEGKCDQSEDQAGSFCHFSRTFLSDLIYL